MWEPNTISNVKFANTFQKIDKIWKNNIVEFRIFIYVFLQIDVVI
jgi:hypothetical protein